MNRRALGARGEALAGDWYVERGYTVLDRNWRCRQGELDLVLERGGVVVFCEVKARGSTAFGTPAEAVTKAKQVRIRHLAARWLADWDGPRAGELRFDVASVLDGTVEIVEGAF